MTYIVAYDIEKDRVRNRLSRYLQNLGVRLQKSVFAVELEKYQYKKMLVEIKKIVGENDNVAVFRLCTGCKNRAIQSRARKEFFYIF